MSLFRTKPIDIVSNTSSDLRRCLTAFDLILFGIGAIIGAGVFVLTGVVAATHAGPGVVFSYAIAGCACLFAALSYAELAASIGGSGSAYAYSYASFGEFFAWIIGWDLLLEYTMSVSTVAIGWAGYVHDTLLAIGIKIPDIVYRNPFEGGFLNLPAVLIIAVLTLLLCLGTKGSSRFNIMIVLIKLISITVFIVVASQHINTAYWHPLLPFGWSGVINGAALVFFAYIGFDAVSTAAEETIHPARDLPIGIIVSVIFCTLIYILVAALLTGIVPYPSLNVASPVANALLQIGQPVAAALVAVGAIAGLTTVMLVMYYGLTRIAFSISRDGLLPGFFSRVLPATGTPVKGILLNGLIIATIAGLMPIGEAAELVNIGTLAAFTFVCAGTIMLRMQQPNLARPFKLPWNPLIPSLGIIFCVYLMAHLPFITWMRFGVWLLLGFVIYFIYSRKHSLLNKR